MDKLYSTDKAIDTINKILKEKDISQKEVSAITGAAQPNVSMILSKTKTQKGSYKFFTVEQLVKLSLELGVSLDELLGIERNEKEKRLTAKDICEFLVRLRNNDLKTMFFKQIQIDEPVLELSRKDYDYSKSEILEEYHKYPLDFYDIKQESVDYYAIYFSCYDILAREYLVTKSLHDAIPEEHPVIVYDKAQYINKFIEQWISISDMLVDGLLDKEKYDRLLESFLNDVPDEI